jgi:heat shock protein HtpX
MTIYTQIENNKRKTWFLLIIGVVSVTTLGYVFGEVSGYGYPITLSAFVYSLISSLISYFYSDKIALTLSKARAVSEEDEPQLNRLVENLCIGSGLPMPAVYIIEDNALNAFATGRDPQHASIAVTRGLMDSLEKLELEGVLAHELSHIQNYDIRVMTIVIILVGTLALLADVFLRSMFWGRSDRKRNGGSGVLVLLGIVLAILAPIAAQIIKLAVSRKREYLADASAALLTRYPDGLASALEKIASSSLPLTSVNAATAHLFISNPLKHDAFHRLFSTHPPIEDRIKILREM